MKGNVGPCKRLFLTQSILIIIIVSTYVIALGVEEGSREYYAISQHTPVPYNEEGDCGESKS